MRSVGGSIGLTLFMLLVDFYVFQGVKNVSQGLSERSRSVIFLAFWIIAIFGLLFFLALPYLRYDQWQKPVRTYIFAILFSLFLAKIIAVPFLMVDDLRRLVQWFSAKSAPQISAVNGVGTINRSLFLSWLGLGIGGGLFGVLIYGFRNKYNYRVRELSLSFAALPKSFHGFKILQISDVHSGSFTNKRAVEHGVELINKQNADIILFTGDLVNDLAEEMMNYKDVFARLKAPMGVYSVFGNHDYGDYATWTDRNEAHEAQEATAGKRLLTPLQQQNLDKLAGIQKEMGWRLLLDEWVPLEKKGEKIALLGVQNISGRGSFHSYGNLKKAYEGCQHLPFKLLMSHDPSHWEAEVTKHFTNIDLMLSGHTHGMQFGVEVPGFRWSPIKWMYKQWAGLYTKNNQKLYVNRGFGFIGYPGRVGILPEITVIELKTT